MALILLWFCCTALRVFMKEDCVGNLKAAESSKLRIYLPQKQGCFVVFFLLFFLFPVSLVGNGGLPCFHRIKPANFPVNDKFLGKLIKDKLSAVELAGIYFRYAVSCLLVTKAEVGNCLSSSGVVKF